MADFRPSLTSIYVIDMSNCAKFINIRSTAVKQNVRVQGRMHPDKYLSCGRGIMVTGWPVGVFLLQWCIFPTARLGFSRSEEVNRLCMSNCICLGIIFIILKIILLASLTLNPRLVVEQNAPKEARNALR